MGKKRMFAALLALLMTVGTLVLPAQAAFTDTAGHWAETAITKWSEEYSIINGYEDGTFRPDNSITRGAFAGILDRFLKFQSTSPAGTFSDLSGNYWEDAILKLHASGVYLGNNGAALAGDTITRQQAVTMIARAFNISGESTTVYYLDADQVAEYARPYLAEMSALGYITDSSDGYFRPTEAITRAEIVTILDNMIEVLIQSNVVYSQDVEGTVMINAAEGAALQDMTIAGDLILAPGVTGTVTLENVTIQGTVRNFGSATVTDLAQQPEETAVGAQNHADAAVFPELISVSQLDIGVSVLIIVFQSPLKNHAVGEKIIGPVALSPVAVAHEDDPGAVVKGQDGRGGIKLIEFCGEGRHVKPSLPGSSGRNQMKSVRKSTARKTLSSGSSGSCAGRNRMCAASRCRRKSCTKKRM